MRTYDPFTCDEELAAIGRGMLDRTLPKSAWTHAGHFAAALWLLKARGLEQVRRELPGAIRAYNEAVGGTNTDSSGYHETITQASLRAAQAFLAGSGARPLFETCNALLASPLGEPDWLMAYWSRELLFSVEARRAWVEPDVAAFPY